MTITVISALDMRMGWSLTRAGLTRHEESLSKDLLEAKDLDELKGAFKKWRRIGWKNVCKLWLEERTPEQLKGEGG